MYSMESVLLVGGPSEELSRVQRILDAAGVAAVPIAEIGADAQLSSGRACAVLSPVLAREWSQAVHRRDEALALASHEFNTPLTVVVGFVSTLLRHWEDLTEEDKLSFLDTVQRRGRDLVRLTDSVLNLSSLKAGSIVVTRRRMAISDAVRAAVEHQGGSRVKVICPDDLEAQADAEHVGVILNNLIDNALAHGAPPVEVYVNRVGSAIELRVFDAGPGIAPSFVPSLFDEYAQASDGPSRTARGLGIGLTVARGLARLSGGSVWYEPQERGACFGLQLPGTDEDPSLPDVLLSRASRLAGEGLSDPDAIIDLVAISGGNDAAVDRARRQALRLGVHAPSCRKAARLLALAQRAA